jgi:hypothetical protein
VDIDTTDLDGLRRACANYSEQLQRKVTVDAASMQFVAVAGDNLDAITMPAALRRRVWTVLANEMASGPTIAGPGPSRWTILTERTQRTRPSCPANLHYAGVTLVPRGSKIILPSCRDTTGSYMWIEAPRPSLRLPAWSRVLTTAARIVAAQLDCEGAS